MAKKSTARKIENLAGIIKRKTKELEKMKITNVVDSSHNSTKKLIEISGFMFLDFNLEDQHQLIELM